MNSLLLLFLTFQGNSISSVAALTDNLLVDSISRHFYRDFYPDMMQKIKMHLYGPQLENFQTNCSQELLQFWGDLDSEKQAAYLDSFGKVGAGILTGNVQYLGYYDQCIDIGNTDYCRFPFIVTLTTTATTTVSSNASFTIPVEFGMCFPSSCDAKDFYNLFFIGSDETFSKSFTDINAVTYTVNVSVSVGYTEPLCPWRDLKWTTSSIVVLTVCVLLVMFVIIGTMVDVSLWLFDDILPKLNLPGRKPQTTITNSVDCEVKHSINEDEPLINAKNKQKTSAYKRGIEFLKDLMLSFSLYKTVPAIMATRQPANAVTSINGIRVISMFWIILGHTFTFGLQFDNYGAGFANIQYVYETIPKRFLFQLVDNNSVSVNSFFVLSGLLLSYLSIKEMNRHQGKFPFTTFYVHRLLRLSPAYSFVVLIYFKLLPHIGSGPLWFFADSVNHCEKYWWTNLLYINNFYPVSMSVNCYPITWYLADVMQFFIISPIFLLLLYHCWKIGFATIGAIMLASIAIKGTLAGVTNLNTNMYQAPGQSSWDIIYPTPYCRINAYLIGILLGFVLYKKWRVKCNLWILICFYSLMWTIAIGSCFIVIFGQYYTWHGHRFTKTENVMYCMFSYTVYSIGIALMIYACHNGFGGVINKFLSWSFWVPLSNLNYMTYLLHPIVLTLMYRTMRVQFIYTDWLLILLFASAVVLSYSMALMVAVSVEYPVANIEKAVYKFAGVKRRK